MRNAVHHAILASMPGRAEVRRPERAAEHQAGGRWAT